MTSGKRRYRSELREQAAQETRQRILAAARKLFSRGGVDPVTIARIAEQSQVGASTVYALFGSKTGILRELMREAIFNARYRSAALALEGERAPAALLAITARIARSIYEGEAREIGLLRGAAAFSRELRKLEREFEEARFELQRGRIDALRALGLLRDGLDVEAARHLMWMYTSRDVYRMLVQERGWTGERYEAWLAETLAHALLRPDGALSAAPRAGDPARPR